MAAFSNNKTLGYDRFQVLNEQVLDDFPSFNIDFMSKLNYGKFSKQDKYGI